MKRFFAIWHCLFCSLALILALIVVTNYAFIEVVWANPSDSYGNDINYIEVWQWNGTAYELRHNLTSSGGTYRIHDNQTTKFVVNIKFNNTLASSTSEAIDLTKVYMNITAAIWLNEELNNTACSLVGDFYYLKEEGVWNSTGYPQAGVTYAGSVLYQGYY